MNRTLASAIIIETFAAIVSMVLLVPAPAHAGLQETNTHSNHHCSNTLNCGDTTGTAQNVQKDFHNNSNCNTARSGDTCKNNIHDVPNK